jgi:hypothetical protein
MMRPNIVQAMLEGISLSQPQPKIPPELIRFLGRAFNAWHVAIPLLESHVIIFPDETRCFDALADLYKAVGEVSGAFEWCFFWCCLLWSCFWLCCWLSLSQRRLTTQTKPRPQHPTHPQTHTPTPNDLKTTPYE